MPAEPVADREESSPFKTTMPDRFHVNRFTEKRGVFAGIKADIR